MYLTSYLEDNIQRLYEDLDIKYPYQLNKYIISDRLDIGIYLSRDPSEAFYWENRYYIFINRDLDSRRRWQDFGHELCHVLRHSGHQGEMPSLFRELQEWQADNFMYHFCVPTFMLRALKLPAEMRRAIPIVAETFNVEYEFAEERLYRYSQKLFAAGLHSR